ncbi:hypothetical protein C0J52_20878, partial [Blattella germanica]
IPEIHVSRFEPLYINKLSLSKGHGPVTVSGSFYNILAHGPSNASATSVIEVIHVKHMKVDFDIDGMSIHLENLFNGNKVLGRTLNNFLNKNAQEVVSELKEPLGDSFAVFFKELMNKALMYIPLDIWIVEDSITEGS